LLNVDINLAENVKEPVLEFVKAFDVFELNHLAWLRVLVLVLVLAGLSFSVVGDVGVDGVLTLL
jgi:hypothetical protein